MITSAVALVITTISRCHNSNFSLYLRGRNVLLVAPVIIPTVLVLVLDEFDS
jgi:hypothetical protein